MLTHPDRLIKRAVSGMLPKNRLRKHLLDKIHVFPGQFHTMESKMLPQVVTHFNLQFMEVKKQTIDELIGPEENENTVLVYESVQNSELGKGYKKELDPTILIPFEEREDYVPSKIITKKP
jgi:hypothetical protein